MKFIYALGLFIAFLISSLLGFSQSNSRKIYDAFTGKEGFVSLGFSKSALKPLEIFLDDDTKSVMYKMKNISFLFYNEEKGDLEAVDVCDRILRQLKGVGYFRIDPNELDCKNCNVNIEGDDVVLIGHGLKKEMDEFHIVVFDNKSCFLFSFYGNITIDDISECSRFGSSTKGIISY